MQITRKSILSGVERTREIDITPDQIERWMNGEFIQNVAPHLSASDREFIISGITDDEWDAEFGSKKDG